VKAVILVFLKINPKRAEYVGGLIIYVNLKLITMKLSVEELEELIGISDPDGVWSLCKDFDMQEELEYIEENYFNTNK